MASDDSETETPVPPPPPMEEQEVARGASKLGVSPPAGPMDGLAGERRAGTTAPQPCTVGEDHLEEEMEKDPAGTAPPPPLVGEPEPDAGTSASVPQAPSAAARPVPTAAPTSHAPLNGHSQAPSFPQSLGGQWDADPATAEMKRALMRKVAQLTKVVVHLNARSDEAESRYERLRAGFEDEIRTITQDAMLKVTAYRRTLAELTDPESLREDARKKEEVWSAVRQATRTQLKDLRKEAVTRRERLVETGTSQLRESTGEVERLSRDLKASLAAFREAVGQSRAELDRHNSEVRERTQNELSTVAAEHKRRLDELRAAQAREVESLKAAREQALSHLRRMHESELTTLRMQALQKRRERVHRLEQDFGEERRTLEQSIAQMGFELDQQRREITDLTGASVMHQQIDAMRVTLDEMTKRVGFAEADVIRARDEAAQRESEVAALQSEVKLLQLRQRAAGAGQVPVPPNAATRAALNAAAQVAAAAAAAAAVTGAGAELSQELQDAIAGAKGLEADLGQSDTELANLDDDLTEKEKEVELLEVEIEEEQLRTHQLQARILEREAALKA